MFENYERYDYLKAVTDDVRELLLQDEVNADDYDDYDDFVEAVNDFCWDCDDITGNASGSYWFSSFKAECALIGNLTLLGEALSEFGLDGRYITNNGAKACDVTIRCYLLSDAIAIACEQLELEEWFDDDIENRKPFNEHISEFAIK